MNLSVAYAMARSLMDLHGLSHVPLEFDQARTAAGKTHYRVTRRTVAGSKRTKVVPGSSRVTRITLSTSLTQLHSEEQVRDTVLHEIAHALVGKEHGHDIIWKTKHLSIGGSGKRTWSEGAEVSRQDAPWVGSCPGGHTDRRFRAPQRVTSCPRCDPKFNFNFVLSWTKNGRAAAMPAKYAAEMARLRAQRGLSSGQEVAASDVAALRTVARQNKLHPLLGKRVRIDAAHSDKYHGQVGTVIEVKRVNAIVQLNIGQLRVPMQLLVQLG